MIDRSPLLLSTLLLLTACGGESAAPTAARTGDVAVANASVAEVARRTARSTAASFEPGEWETVVAIESANIPGMPAGMMKELERRNLGKTSVRSCMTPEQAAKPDEAVFAGKRANCRFDRYVMTGGKLDATMSCAADGPAKRAVIAMQGSFTPTRFDLVNSMTAAPVPGHPPVTMRSRVTGRRLGACKG